MIVEEGDTVKVSYMSNDTQNHETLEVEWVADEMFSGVIKGTDQEFNCFKGRDSLRFEGEGEVGTDIHILKIE